MSITTAIVKKLILEYIGGKKLKGNSKNTNIDGKKILVQLEGSLKKEFSTLTEMKDSLLKNPSLENLNKIQDHINDISQKINVLSTPLKNSILTELTNLSSAKNVMTAHTDVLSGLEDSDDLMSIFQIKNLVETGADIANFISSVANTDYLEFDFNDELNQILNADQNDSQLLSDLTDRLIQKIQGKTTEIYDRVTQDTDAQLQLRENLEMQNLQAMLDEHENDPVVKKFLI